jgi:phage tail-like protein
MAEAAAQTGKFQEPYRGYNFKIDVGGKTQAHFTQVTGLGVEVEAIKFREGGQSQVVHRLPGRVQYGEVTLRYGLTDSPELWRWFTTAIEGNVDRRHVSIILLDSGGTKPVMKWDLLDAWPSRWRGAPLDALGQEVAIEELTLVFETLKRE